MRAAVVHGLGEPLALQEVPGPGSVNECFEEVERGPVDARLVFDFGAREDARHAPVPG